MPNQPKPRAKPLKGDDRADLYIEQKNFLYSVAKKFSPGNVKYLGQKEWILTVIGNLSPQPISCFYIIGHDIWLRYILKTDRIPANCFCCCRDKRRRSAICKAAETICCGVGGIQPSNPLRDNLTLA